MPPINTPEIIDTVVSTVLPTNEIDYKAQLEKIGLTEEQIGSDLINRFKEHLRLYQSPIEAHIALLKERIDRGDSTTEQKVTRFEAWLTEQEIAIPQEETPTLTGAVQDIASSARQTVEERTAEYTQRAEDVLSSKIETQLQKHTIVAWIADKFFGLNAETFIQRGKEHIANKGGGFSAIGITLSLLGLGGLKLFEDHADTIANIGRGIFGDTPNTGNVLPENDPQSTTETTVPEVQGNSIEVQSGKRAAATTGGYILMGYMSGKQREKNNNTMSIYEKLGSLSYRQIQEKYTQLEFVSGSIKPGSIQEVFGIEGNINEQEYFNTIEGIVGPYNGSFLNSMFVPASHISSLIRKPGSPNEYSSAALEIFETHELDLINGKTYEELSLNDIARLSVLYCKRFYSNTTAQLNDAISETSQGVRGFIFGEEVQEKIGGLVETNQEDMLYPENISRVFGNILTGNAYIHSNVHNLLNRPGLEDINLSEKDTEKLGDIVAFRDQVFGTIPLEFSLGIPGFEGRFNDVINYGSIISLYLLLGGRDLSQRTDMDNIIIYTWVYNLFDGSNQGIYESAAIESISDSNDNLSEDEKNILTVVLYRVLEGNRNGIIDRTARGLALGHELIKDTILGPVPISDRQKDYLAYAVESLGAYGLWRILSFFPTTRAVLFVTGGVTIGAVLLLSQEAVYQDLNSDIKESFDSFLRANFQQEGEDLSAEDLRKGIESGEVGATDLISRLNRSIEGALTS